MPNSNGRVPTTKLSNLFLTYVDESCINLLYCEVYLKNLCLQHIFQVPYYIENISFVTCMRSVYITWSSIYLKGRRNLIWKAIVRISLLLIIFICALLSYPNLVHICRGRISVLCIRKPVTARIAISFIFLCTDSETGRQKMETIPVQWIIFCSAMGENYNYVGGVTYNEVTFKPNLT